MRAVGVPASEERTLSSFEFRNDVWIANASSQRMIDAFDHLRRTRRYGFVGAVSRFGKTSIMARLREQHPVVKGDGWTRAPMARTGLLQEGSTSRGDLDRAIVNDIGEEILKRHDTAGLFAQAVQLLATCETEILVPDESNSLGRLQMLHIKSIVEAVENYQSHRETGAPRRRRPMAVMFLATITDDDSMPTEVTGLRPYEYEQFAGRLDPRLGRIAVPALSRDELRPVIKRLEVLHRNAFPNLQLTKWTPVIYDRLLATEFRPLMASVPMGNVLDLVQSVMEHLWVAGIGDLFSESFGRALITAAAEDLGLLRVRERDDLERKAKAMVAGGRQVVSPFGVETRRFGGMAELEATMRERTLKLAAVTDFKRRRLAATS